MKTEVMEDEEEESDRRGRFIKKKYKQRRWQDKVQYNIRMLDLLFQKRTPRGHARCKEDRDKADDDCETTTVKTRSRTRSSLQERIAGIRRVRECERQRRGSYNDGIAAERTCDKDRRSDSCRDSHEKTRSSRRPHLSRCASDPTALRKLRCAVNRTNSGQGRGRSSSLFNVVSSNTPHNSIILIEAPKSMLRERRLSAVANMFVALPYSTDDVTKHPSFSHAA
jgi:hypothetical protein